MTTQTNSTLQNSQNFKKATNTFKIISLICYWLKTHPFARKTNSFNSFKCSKKSISVFQIASKLCKPNSGFRSRISLLIPAPWEFQSSVKYFPFSRSLTTASASNFSNKLTQALPTNVLTSSLTNNSARIPQFGKNSRILKTLSQVKRNQRLKTVNFIKCSLIFLWCRKTRLVSRTYFLLRNKVTRITRLNSKTPSFRRLLEPTKKSANLTRKKELGSKKFNSPEIKKTANERLFLRTKSVLSNRTLIGFNQTLFPISSSWTSK